ncbi:uncharacterized protein PHACADRAFT_250313 [Phanerochaete carnosa HHB-10118-sp]|uniref:Asl1-like glycosyl hydrolase catalytic domain-containing protein n=1 Tax=Phanerochaete carnosa (strain HHB-10118-sp) TaxID=650164 RepID=K5WKI5_PHACS|nr:uncharacterized protein PHACADRAFT_250313 [Phanerochaete carnosa HHB-10118-sp]EKM59669.1 hypothetical protein PHACADRAFT_250313 [Phanerochaete carnosa HHB-10118-sp]
MASKLINLLALACLAALATTFAVAPVNALATGIHQNSNRQVHHDVIARRSRISNKKRQNNSTQRCKPRPSTSLSSAAVSTSSAAPITSTAPSPAPTSETQSSSPAVTAAPSSSSPAVTAAPSSSSSAAPASTPSSAPSNGQTKVGLAWPNGPSSDLQFYSTSVTGWIYSWSPYTPDPNHQFPNLQFMAQLWGPDQVSDFESVVTPGYAGWILGMNEPNEPGQSNMNPQDGATLWMQNIEPKRAQGYQTCSPATSSNPNGFTWIADMLEACNGGCTFDCIAVHWYDVDFSLFQSYVTQWYNTYNLPIYITEFAPQNFNGGAQPTTSDVWSFYGQAMPWIMDTPWIAAAFPFGFMQNMGNVIVADQLMGSNGQPTDLGQFIISGNY